jgi:hypothetical protein
MQALQDEWQIADLGKEVLHCSGVGFSVLRPYREADRFAHAFPLPAASVAATLG